EDIANDPQLAVRNFWQRVSCPGLDRTLKYPGGFAVINGERLEIRRPAPRVGEHNHELFVKELGLSAFETKDLQLVSA
ncbi:MAG TPA: hypothetical protein VKF81_02545, partial [Blastocatellia bacterium]|nr:hypothetical protein [Blastocatellia bacterium]